MTRCQGVLLALMVATVFGLADPEVQADATIGSVVPGIVTSLIGNGAGDGGAAIAAWLNEPEAVAVDASGNLYVGDTKSCVVRKIDISGTINTIAGTGVCGFNGDALPATSAQLTLTRGVALDSAGNVYIADAGAPVTATPGNCRIWKIDADASLRTVAGNGTCDYGGDGGSPTRASLKNAKSMAVDSHGDLYIADYDNCRIRRVHGDTISTAAGSVCDVVDPFGIAIDNTDNVYIADAGNSRIELLSGGNLVTVAGPPDIAIAEGVAVDTSGNLLIADTDHCVIKRIARPVYTPGSPPVITTIAGNGTCGYSGEGAALDVELNHPGGVAADSAGNVFVADTMNCRIRKIAGPNVTTVAGNGGCHAVKPSGIAVDASGNVFVSDSNVLDCHVLMVTSSGAVSRTAGLATIGPLDSRLPCGFSGDGPAASVKLKTPGALALDNLGNVYIADTGNCRVRKVANGTMTTVVGTGSCRYGGDGGLSTDATINRPQGIAVDRTGVLYVADTDNCAIRMVAAGVITTIAGSTTCGFGGDDGPATGASLNSPGGVAVDSAGDVYIADTQNCRVRAIDASSRKIRTVAGDGACGYGGDGQPASLASLNHPSDLAVDSSGQIFVADTDNCRIRKIAADGGTIITAAGDGTCGYGGDGGPATRAAFNQPGRVTIDGEGNIYIADFANGRVRMVRPGAAGAPTEAAPPSVGPSPGATGAPTPTGVPTGGDSGPAWTTVGLIAAAVGAVVVVAAAVGFARRRRSRG